MDDLDVYYAAKTSLSGEARYLPDIRIDVQRNEALTVGYFAGKIQDALPDLDYSVKVTPTEDEELFELVTTDGLLIMGTVAVSGPYPRDAATGTRTSR